VNTSATVRSANHLSKTERELLDLLLEEMMQLGCGVPALKFRAEHYAEIETLEILEAKGWVRRKDDQYLVQSPVLPLLETERARALMSNAELVYGALRAYYLEKQQAPVRLAVLAARVSLPLADATVAIRTMLDAPGWCSGYSTDLDKDDSFVTPTESVLKYPSFAKLVEEVRSWSAVFGPTPPVIPSPPIAVQPTSADTRTAEEDDTRFAWPPVRACLQEFSFYDIKSVAGLAGFDVTVAAHLEQNRSDGRSASKGQLMTAVDGQVSKMEPAGRRRFLTLLIEEILRRRPEARERLDEYLGRLGWSFVEGTLVPLEIFDVQALAATPSEAHHDLLKAAQRLRDGDLGGAISAACGAVDTATSRAYEELDLGDPAVDSFQQRCKKAIAAKGILPSLEQQLGGLGWPQGDVVMFGKNLEGALTQGAFVLQKLRSQMGDVHGTKPVVQSLVFDCLRWAELIVGSLVERPDAPSAPTSQQRQGSHGHIGDDRQPDVAGG
jgi:hypothetical protein